MSRLEILLVVVALVVASMYILINRLPAVESGYSARRHSNEFEELNQTLVALNSALKDALWEAQRKDSLRKGSTAEKLLTVDVRLTQTISRKPDDKNVATEVSSNPRSLSGKKAVVFTMDSISQYEENSKHGGAAGELLVRYCFQEAMAELGVHVDVIRSDSAFNSVNGNDYDFIILDPWTWAGKGWVPKPNIRLHQEKIFILDFFGTKELKKSLAIPLSRVLTPFATPWNTFLGFFLRMDIPGKIAKKKQGVIWGKDPKHFKGQKEMLAFVSVRVPLISTSQTKVFDAPGISWLGHQTPASWNKLLAESRFVLGLGDPLLGPSAIDAVAAGCMYINPVYDIPARGIYKTQHDFAADVIGFPHVCSVKLSDRLGLMECIQYALDHEMEPFVPEVLSKSKYVERVKDILINSAT